MNEPGKCGTLGFSSDDPAEFFGFNDEAYIDEDGMLHGLPPFEALDSVFGHPDEADGGGSGFGTLGCTQDDPSDFFGSNRGAFIDSGGFLHGLPEFDALSDGMVVSPSPIFDGCFYVFCAAKWEDNVRELEGELRREREGGERRMDPAVRVRAERIVVESPRRAAFERGLVAIPDDIIEGYGIEPGEELCIVGNVGFVEVWRNSERNTLLEGFDLFGALMGESQS